MSSPSQLKALWRRFSGQYVLCPYVIAAYANSVISFLNLVQHRFASHCCEMLFAQSATVVSKEMDPGYTDETAGDEVFASMESLFLYMLNVHHLHSTL
jgi:nucleolar protein 9